MTETIKLPAEEPRDDAALADAVKKFYEARVRTRLRGELPIALVASEKPAEEPIVPIVSEKPLAEEPLIVATPGTVGTPDAALTQSEGDSHLPEAELPELPAGAISLEEEVLPPPPPDFDKFEEKKQDLEGILRDWLENITRGGLNEHSLEKLKEYALMILDLHEGRRPIHVIRAGLTEEQQKFVWEPICISWWNGLGAEKRQAFIDSTRNFLAAVDPSHDSQLSEGKVAGYRRLLDGIFVRQPNMLTELFFAVKNGEEPFCPQGFTEAACAEWKSFVKNEWFSSLSADVRKKLESAGMRRQNEPAMLRLKIAELIEKMRELHKRDSLAGKFSALFKSESGSRDELVRQIEQLNQEVLELKVSLFIDEETALVDSKQYSIGERTGFGARALGAVKNFFGWVFSQEKTKQPESLRARILGSLSGAYHNVPAAIEPWLVEAGCARAAGALAEKNAISPKAHHEDADALQSQFKKHGENGRPEIDWSAYLLALQERITIEIARTVQRSQSLKAASEKEPLLGLLAAYKTAAGRVAPSFRKQSERLNLILSELMSEAEQDLYARGALRAGKVQHMVSGNDTHWIATLMEESAEQADGPQMPKLGEGGAAGELLKFKYSFIVGPQLTAAAVVRRVLERFYPTKSASVLNRDVLHFMSRGLVSEVDGPQNKHLVTANGVDSMYFYVGDKVTAVQDDTAPLGVRLEVLRNPPPSHKGYYLDDSQGNPDWYYERTTDGSVYAWKFDRAGRPQLYGHLDGRRFVREHEQMWSYTDKSGKEHKVGENAHGVYFKPDGTVVLKTKASGAKAFSEMGKIAKPFEKSVVIEKLNGELETVDLHATDHVYLVTPKNMVVEYHPSVNEIRELGVLKG